jgi:polyisoprenoid-binding protein YceI
MKRYRAPLCAGLWLAAAPAFAQPVDYGASRIDFTYRQLNVPVNGAFGKFRADIRFDAARPERSRAEVVVDLANVDTGSLDGDTEIRRKAWFDVAAHPTATFVTTGVRRLGPDRYEIAGNMTIKGRTRKLTLPASVQRAGNVTTFEGAFPLRRLAFAIGEGPWADTDTVADEVQVRFRFVQIAATPAK